MMSAKNLIPNPLNQRLPLSEIWGIFKRMFALLKEKSKKLYGRRLCAWCF
jgi:hypothetical protein